MILSQMETQFICKHQSLKKAEYTRSKLERGITGFLEQKGSLLLGSVAKKEGVSRLF